MNKSASSINEGQAALDVRQLVLDAEARCRPHINETPLEYSPGLSELTGGDVWLKLDSMQKTFSFKFRGAVSKVMSLTDEMLDKGIVTASTGNFALAMAEAVRLRGRSATIYVANNIDPMRLSLLKALGLEIVLHGDDAGDAEKEARRIAGVEGKMYISPYNDPEVVGGQGTCALEITRQLPDVDSVIIAVGGGGLISGCSGWLKSVNPGIEVLGVLPENSPVMLESLKAGALFEMDIKPTLADTCSGNIDLDSITFDICRENVDEMFAISEPEIEAGIRYLFEQHRLVVEGSAALSIALLQKYPERFKGRKTVALICGRNIDTELFKRIIS
jgi:threonine dehydratase